MSDLYDKVMVPSVSPEDERSEAIMDAETAEEILAYYGALHYTFLDHLLFRFWETGMRIVASRVLVVFDIDINFEWGYSTIEHHTLFAERCAT